MTDGRHSRLKWVVAGPPALFLAAFFLAPALIVLGASFREPGEFGGLAPLAGGAPAVSLDAWRFLAGEGIYAWIVAKGIAVAVLTTATCLAIAYPLAWLVARSPRGKRDLLVLAIALPLASNLLVRIYAWILLLGPAGLLYTPFAVMAGMVYVHLPFMALPIYVNLERHDPALVEAARDLGANAWSTFWRVTWPLSLPGVLSGSALVFIPVLGMFAIPELLGGTGDILVGNLIKEQFLDNRDWPLGSALSIALTAAVLGVAGLAALAARAPGRTP